LRVWNELKFLMRRARKSWLSGLFYSNPRKAQARKLSRRIQLDRIGDRIRGRTVLDLGCAEGYVAELLLQRGASLVHGIDINRRRVRCAAAALTGDRARFFVANLETGDLDKLIDSGGLGPAYDVVVLCSVYHKLRADKRAEILRRCLRLSETTFVCRVPAAFVDEVIATACACGMCLSDRMRIATCGGIMLVFDRDTAERNRSTDNLMVARDTYAHLVISAAGQVTPLTRSQAAR
jgi:SAM-dependent methyltransferase